MHSEIQKEQSSVSVKEFENGGMVVIRHFTGTLLLSRHEANHLRTLLDVELAEAKKMLQEEAQAIVKERDEMLSGFLSD